MKKETPEIEKFIKSLKGYKCVCGGRDDDLQGDGKTHKLVSSGKEYSYVIISCLKCGLMRFHSLDSELFKKFLSK